MQRLPPICPTAAFLAEHSIQIKQMTFILETFPLLIPAPSRPHFLHHYETGTWNIWLKKPRGTKIIKLSIIAWSKSHCSLNDLYCGSFEADFNCKGTEEWPRTDHTKEADEFAHFSFR